MLRGFEKLNYLARSGKDFIFIISYDKSEILSYPLDNLPSNIAFNIEGVSFGNPPHLEGQNIKYHLKKYPIPFEEYQKKFNIIQEHILAGDTYLLNLTQPTYIESSYTLEDFYIYSEAKYKLYLKDNFVCFSPECFVKIKDNTIYTYPMKGTIDSSIKDAKEKILANNKEFAEHTMIVDLMRNDLNIIGSKTEVKRFRYIDEIYAGDKKLLQVSSEISSELPKGWRENIGDILNKITPAGSITGTPKKKTIEIIKSVEGYDRGFYTGIFGVCIGDSLNSAVMIRFVQKDRDRLIYKSGGGITVDSDVKMEYQEMLDKVY